MEGWRGGGVEGWGRVREGGREGRGKGGSLRAREEWIDKGNKGGREVRWEGGSED